MFGVVHGPVSPQPSCSDQPINLAREGGAGGGVHVRRRHGPVGPHPCGSGQPKWEGGPVTPQPCLLRTSRAGSHAPALLLRPAELGRMRLQAAALPTASVHGHPPSWQLDWHLPNGCLLATLLHRVSPGWPALTAPGLVRHLPELGAGMLQAGRLLAGPQPAHVLPVLHGGIRPAVHGALHHLPPQEVALLLLGAPSTFVAPETHPCLDHGVSACAC